MALNSDTGLSTGVRPTLNDAMPRELEAYHLITRRSWESPLAASVALDLARALPHDRNHCMRITCAFQVQLLYCYPRLMVAVNAAITLERPLLIKGEPGTGKTCCP